MKNLLIITLFTSVCLLACNSNSNSQKNSPPETLFANFYIRYLQPEKQVKAEANFLRGDSIASARSVQIEGGVAFQNSGMESRKSPNGAIRYNYENLFDYPSEFTFSFKNLDGKTQKQILQLTPLNSFTTGGSVSQQKGGKVTLENDTLGINESLVFLMSDSKNQTISFMIENAAGSTEFDIPAEKLSNLSLGNIKLYLVRKLVEEVNEPGYSYTSTIEYYSNNYEFELIE